MTPSQADPNLIPYARETNDPGIGRINSFRSIGPTLVFPHITAISWKGVLIYIKLCFMYREELYMVILNRNRFINPEQIMSGMSNEVDGMGNERTNVFPRINIYEETDRWVITFEVPGVDPNDFSLSMRNTLMTIRGKRSTFYANEQSRVHNRESCVNGCDFLRSVRLPTDADPENIHAHFKHGMVFVHVEKTEKAQEKMIQVSIHQDA